MRVLFNTKEDMIFLLADMSILEHRKTTILKALKLSKILTAILRRLMTMLIKDSN